MLFRRVVHPAFDPIDHVNKLGIKLKSTALSENNRKRPSSPRSLRSFRIRSAKTRLSARAKSSITRFTPTTQNVQLIHNMVVPVCLYMLLLLAILISLVTSRVSDAVEVIESVPSVCVCVCVSVCLCVCASVSALTAEPLDL